MVHPGAKGGRPRILRPRARLRHIIPAERLNKRYFRRWFYWRGISRALLYDRSGLDMEAPEQTTLDFSTVPHIFGVPRYLYRKAFPRQPAGSPTRFAAGALDAFEHQLWLCFFAGIVRQRFRDTRARRTAVPRRARSMTTHQPSPGDGPRIEPGGEPQVDATILICTYNRAAYPRGYARQHRDDTRRSRVLLDVLVVDNNSTDHTRDIVGDRAAIGSRCRCATCSRDARESRTH